MAEAVHISQLCLAMRNVRNRRSEARATSDRTLFCHPIHVEHSVNFSFFFFSSSHRTPFYFQARPGWQMVVNVKADAPIFHNPLSFLSVQLASSTTCKQTPLSPCRTFAPLLDCALCVICSYATLNIHYLPLHTPFHFGRPFYDDVAHMFQLFSSNLLNYIWNSHLAIYYLCFQVIDS